MSDYKIKIDILNEKINIIKSYDTQYFSIDYIIKMLDLKRNEIRMYKINKLFKND